MRTELIEKLKYVTQRLHSNTLFKEEDWVNEAIQALSEEKVVSAEEVKAKMEKEARAYEYGNQISHSNYHAFKSGYTQAMHDYAQQPSDATKEQLKFAFEAGQKQQFAKFWNWNSGYDNEHSKFNKNELITFDTFYQQFLNREEGNK